MTHSPAILRHRQQLIVLDGPYSLDLAHYQMYFEQPEIDDFDLLPNYIKNCISMVICYFHLLPSYIKNCIEMAICYFLLFQPYCHSSSMK